MIKVTTAVLFALLISFSSFGQTDKEYHKTLYKMFLASGTEQAYQSALEQMFSMYKEEFWSIDEEVWDELEAEFSKTSIDDLTTMLVPVYAKYLTIEDLKEIIEFYESPVGQKFAEKTPLIMQESMQIGQEWGKKVGEDFMEKLKARGY